jgi:hypothetical protein
MAGFSTGNKPVCSFQDGTVDVGIWRNEEGRSRFTLKLRRRYKKPDHTAGYSDYLVPANLDSAIHLLRKAKDWIDNDGNVGSVRAEG